ncbi:carboxypeptidase Q-like [Littorina saxatilis]|uniref:Carboxypeptidase Q n=1 Tax=Littorina saxatilis TaxID=31220 RepID=A0AAN9C2P3_9CAEN
MGASQEMAAFWVLCCALFTAVSSYSVLDEKLLFQRSLAEIARVKSTTDHIIDFTVNGKGQNQTYKRLAEFVDKFGSRLTGSQNLENAIDYMLNTLRSDGLENVHGEPVTVPHWVRGEESAELLQPRSHPLAILGLGYSVGTPPEGITAQVLVVRSFDELKARASEAKGKIVVYNEDFVSYGTTVAYRSNGAAEGAKVGAVATLIRSVTPYSIYSPHTGMQDYQDGVPKIPTACITIEDAQMLWRMSQRGEKIVIKLTMGAKNLPPAQSRNTVAEIIGHKYPEQVVLVSGHLDSWDVGQGAMDDGGGAFISWQALSIIRQLGLRPKRTMRAVLWTGEEMGIIGGQSYWERHKGNITNFDLVMESDIGTFTPLGIDFTGNDQATKIMKHLVGTLLTSVNASKLSSPAEVSDVPWWIENGVPGGSLINANQDYFFYHHSNGDMMTVEDAHTLDLCSAVWAVVSYAVADMEDMLPR